MPNAKDGIHAQMHDKIKLVPAQFDVGLSLHLMDVVSGAQELCGKLYETAPSTDQDLIEAIQGLLDDTGRLLMRLNNPRRHHLDEVLVGKEGDAKT